MNAHNNVRGEFEGMHERSCCEELSSKMAVNTLRTQRTVTVHALCSEISPAGIFPPDFVVLTGCAHLCHGRSLMGCHSIMFCYLIISLRREGLHGLAAAARKHSRETRSMENSTIQTRVLKNRNEVSLWGHFLW